MSWQEFRCNLLLLIMAHSSLEADVQQADVVTTDTVSWLCPWFCMGSAKYNCNRAKELNFTWTRKQEKYGHSCWLLNVTSKCNTHAQRLGSPSPNKVDDSHTKLLFLWWRAWHHGMMWSLERECHRSRTWLIFYSSCVDSLQVIVAKACITNTTILDLWADKINISIELIGSGAPRDSYYDWHVLLLLQ
jgi:hypothetical protein